MIARAVIEVEPCKCDAACRSPIKATCKSLRTSHSVSHLHPDCVTMLIKLISAGLLVLVLQSCTAKPLIGYYPPAPIRHYPPVMPSAALFIPRPVGRPHYHQLNSFDGRYCTTAVVCIVYDYIQSKMLIHFKGPSVDYSYALELLSHWKPTKEQIAVNYFAFSDTNLDGAVTEAEMAVTFLKLGLSLDDADLMSDKIQIYDSNGICITHK